MKITIEPTTLVCQFAATDGVSVRVWEGTTDAGTPIHVYIALMANPPTAEADAEIREGLDDARDASPDIVNHLTGGMEIDFSGAIVSIETEGTLQ